jgi:hypothetical protein
MQSLALRHGGQKVWRGGRRLGFAPVALHCLHAPTSPHELSAPREASTMLLPTKAETQPTRAVRENTSWTSGGPNTHQLAQGIDFAFVQVTGQLWDDCGTDQQNRKTGDT